MKLGRLGPLGHEIPVVQVEDRVFDLSSITDDIDASFWESGGVDEGQRRPG